MSTTTPLQVPIEDKTPSSSNIVNPDTLAVTRMFKDGKEAYTAYKELRQNNRGRNNKNAEIQKKMNGEPPYKPAKLKSLGQDWRNNRPTGFISTLIDRIKPPYKQMIQSAKTLTFAKFPGTAASADSESKADIFRDEITSGFRQWPNWPDFESQLVHENVTFGFVAAERESPYEWRPLLLRQDEVFFPADCSKDVDKIQMYGRVRRFLPHELIKYLVDPETSADAGWNIENLIKAINKAAPITKNWDSDDYARRFQDLMREGSVASMFTSATKYIELGQLAVREPNGSISVFVFTDGEGDSIFTKFDQYEKMSQILNVFSIEVGSGPLMTSKGAGRVLYNTHISVDKARNLIADNCYLSGLMILKMTGDRASTEAPLKVMHPVALVGKGFEVQDKAVIPANIDAFFQLDRHMSSVAELQVGTFLPGQILNGEGETRTASEVNYVASIDAQIREAVILRFFVQVVAMVTEGQKVICHPEHVTVAKVIFDALTNAGEGAEWVSSEVVTAFEKANLQMPPTMVPYTVPGHLDEEAVRICLRMMKRGLTAENILLLAFSPSNDISIDTSAQYAQAMVQVAASYKGDPGIDQVELKRRDISAQVGSEAAESLVIEETDTTIQQEQTRLQILELTSMMSAGDSMDPGISPRDVDLIHLQVMIQKLQPSLATLVGNLLPEWVQAWTNVFTHWAAHVQQAHTKGEDPAKIKPFEDALKAASGAFEQEKARLGQTPATAVPPTTAAPAAAVASEPAPPAPPVVDPSVVPDPASTASSIASPPRPTPPHPQ